MAAAAPGVRDVSQERHGALIQFLNNLGPVKQPELQSAARRVEQVAAPAAAAAAAADPRVSERAPQIVIVEQHNHNHPERQMLPLFLSAPAPAAPSVVIHNHSGRENISRVETPKATNKRQSKQEEQNEQNKGLAALGAVVAIVVGFVTGTLFKRCADASKRYEEASSSLREVLQFNKNGPDSTPFKSEVILNMHKTDEGESCKYCQRYEGRRYETKLLPLQRKLNVLIQEVYNFRKREHDVREQTYDKWASYRNGTVILTASSVAVAIGAYVAIPWLVTAGVVTFIVASVFVAIKIGYHWSDKEWDDTATLQLTQASQEAHQEALTELFVDEPVDPRAGAVHNCSAAAQGPNPLPAPPPPVNPQLKPQPEGEPEVEGQEPGDEKWNGATRQQIEDAEAAAKRGASAPPAGDGFEKYNPEAFK